MHEVAYISKIIIVICMRKTSSDYLIYCFYHLCSWDVISPSMWCI